MQYERIFTIGIKDLQRFHQMLTLERWRLGILGFGALGALAAWLLMGSDTVTKAVTAVLFALELMLVITLTTVIANRTTIKEQTRRSGKENYTQHIRITPAGVHGEAHGKKSRTDFEKLLRVKETPHAFYLFTKANQAWILPKNQMGDPAAESKQLREIFSAVIASGRLKLLK